MVRPLTLLLSAAALLSACGGPSWPNAGQGGHLGQYRPLTEATPAPAPLAEARARVALVRAGPAPTYAPGRLRAIETLLARAEREAQSDLIDGMAATLGRLNLALTALDQSLSPSLALGD